MAERTVQVPSLNIPPMFLVWKDEQGWNAEELMTRENCAWHKSSPEAAIRWLVEELVHIRDEGGPGMEGTILGPTYGALLQEMAFPEEYLP